MTSPPLRPNALARSFLSDLSENQTHSAAVTLATLANHSGWVEHGFFRALAPQAEKHPAAFLDALLAAEETTFSRLLLIAKALEIGSRIGRLDAVRARIAALKASDTFPVVHFSNADILLKIAAAPAITRDVTLLKYPEIGDPTVGTFAAFREKCSARLSLSPGLTDKLYENTLHVSMPRSDWERRLRAAACTDHILMDYTILSRFLPAALKHDFSAHLKVSGLDQSALPLFEELRSSKGVLFVFMHGGFPVLVREAFRLLDPGGVRVGTDPKSKDTISTAHDPKAALYLMLRAIEDGRSVLIPADGADGKGKMLSTVLGKNFRLAEGAPFVAYETGCETVWLSIHRQDELFVPRLVIGPKRDAGERYDSFRKRWLEFYLREIEALLRGAPDDLALRMPWERSLSTPVRGTTLQAWTASVAGHRSSLRT